MTDLSPRLGAPASSERVAALHQLCDADYAKGQAERAAARITTVSYTAFSAATTTTEPSDLEVAVRVAHQLLDSDSVLSLREALRLLLRAIGAEPAVPVVTEAPPLRRCPAAHRDDPTPCTGPAAVMVLDAGNAGSRGCEHHGARLLASLDGGRVYALPDTPAGAAIRVFKAAADLPPFAWTQRGEGR
ncbi:hypothetical protein ABZ869_01495 [Streptomyces sp. NPDC046928]|uniref:hypothetical protein n=1 Tax=Streptomyces sp. NPDC046928 TaxID=3155021 RepID=UPI0033ED0BCF